MSDNEDSEEHAGEVAEFLDEMRQERFDLAIQMHGGGAYSNPFTLALGARLTAGLKTPDAAPLDRWVPYQYWQREVLRYLEVVSLVGARPVTLEPHLRLRAEDLEESFRVVPESGRRIVLIHPGVGDPMRRWPASNFAAVGDALGQSGAQILVTAGRNSEREFVEAVINDMKYPARNLAEKLSLGGLAGLLSRCDLAVGNDSGPLQMAVALGTPTVGIFWCGNLMTAGPVTQAKHRQLVSWRLECPVCGRNTLEDPCGHKVSYVTDVRTEDVIAAALQLFGDDGLWRRSLPVISLGDQQAWAG